MSRPLMAVIGVVITCTSSGCGQTFGGLLYHFNILQRPSIPARFKLTTGPLLILVDDDLSLLTWPQGRDLLADDIGRPRIEWSDGRGAFMVEDIVAMKLPPIPAGAVKGCCDKR